jgi:membrane fusion protein, heavy metal efflux system
MKFQLISTLAMAFVMVACHNHENGDHTHDNDSGHDHDHGEVKLFLSAYGEHFEVFAETDPFAKGSPSTILAHITHLADFKPLNAGRVTASLIVGNKGIRQALDTPERPGIYRFSLSPEETGTARLLITVNVGDIEEVLETASVYVYADAHEAIHQEEELMVEVPGATVFTKEQSWRVDFATSQVQKQTFGPVIKTTGLVLPSLGDETTLNAQTNGLIAFSGNMPYEGSMVAAGKPIMTISGGSLAESNAAVRYREARNNFERSKADHDRISLLVTEGILSERELLDARNAYLNAEATFENLRRHFSENGQSVTSPWSGYVKQLLVSEGQFVEMGQPIIRIARNREQIIRAEVQQQYAGAINMVKEVNISWGQDHTTTVTDLSANVLTIGQVLNPQTNMLPVSLLLKGSAIMLPGSLVNVYFKTSSANPVLVVPNTALIEEQGNFFVFVQIHPESFLKQQVKVGQTDGMLTEIASGLAGNERIVTKGSIMVKLAAASGNLDPHAGHVH